MKCQKKYPFLRKRNTCYTVNSTLADYYDPVVLSATDSTRNDLVCESRLLTNFAKVEVKSTADAAYQRAFWQRDSANLAQDNLQTNLFRVKHPFGMEMPGRTMGGYRYGFNGKEKDTEGEWGAQTHYDYGFRIYEPGIGRFLSVDPLAATYPYYTPYQFAGDKPVWANDLDGLEPNYTSPSSGEKQVTTDRNTGIEAEWYSIGIGHGDESWGIAATEVTVTAKKDGSTLVSSSSINSPKAVMTLSMSTFTKLGASHDRKNGNGLYGNYTYNRYGLEARMEYGNHYRSIYQNQGGQFMFAVVAIPTAPILLAEGVGSLGVSTSLKLFGINSMRQVGIQFTADFIAQGISNKLQGKSIVDDYNAISGLSNALFKNGYVANYIGGQFNWSYNRGLAANTFGGAVLNSAVAGSFPYGRFGSRPILKNPTFVKEVGLHSIPNSAGAEYQYLYDEGYLKGWPHE